jgi:3-phenylpropionate/cinnamic acid dioxygenase small subunit
VIGLEQLSDLYARYAEVLDDGRLGEWPEFFTEQCRYRIVPRENWDNGLPLATVHAESRGMLQDRVDALTNAMVFSPRYYRRFLTNTRIVERDGNSVVVRQNVLVVQTLINKPSEILLCGTAHDVLTDDDGVMRFSQRIIVYDSEMILNSLIFPI